MPRYKLTIEYDGTGLAGWQKQKDAPSVQEHIENSIFKYCNKHVNLYTAGRTDAGVHAIGQVAHFDIDEEYSTDKIIGAINQHIKPNKIAILACEKVSDLFHARFSAKKRYYLYKIVNRRSPLALDRGRAWFVPVNLDIEEMKKAANYLIGNHDFTSFRDSQCQSKSPIRTLDEIKIVNIGQEIFIYVSAKSFLHHMVRNITGTLKFIGEGKLSACDIPKILEDKKRCSAGPTAPAHGLYFTKIDY